MVNITQKNHSLRKAIAEAVVTVSSYDTMLAIREKRVPKGDIFEFSRAAGLLAIKKTSDLIPDCHPLPVEYASITYSLQEMNVIIQAEVHTIYKTGVEVEAMHGASLAALTIYDMLKPIDSGVFISTIKLKEKKGGKSDFRDQSPEGITAAVVVCSDSVSRGLKDDTAGKAAYQKLQSFGVTVIANEVIPDDVNIIEKTARNFVAEKCRLLLFIGGTGLSPRDVTPEAITPLFTRPIPGIMEIARRYGQERMPYAMLSRGVAGFIEDTLVLTLPGSPKGTVETMDALFPHVLHVFRMAEGRRHD